ncbi:aromatic-ring-hydroxylating dioxygenase subunit beta [Glaciimonas immobilis]|uniref:3-phenylpropionate/cinnamic acid dioxygenase small subunit n=1 Tax=Glaciimonas immobilis TaxID=728004 RepID=A0A840RT37_9BURK|nr:3-phenylpropionate/cinnamic acid dioxygenase subunit beta [Glaciimonas immobilis]KAF3996158.1 3-phenylpropionate/cinnamic acid dioxygenase subunit beta [Glaciimonas immobilis]MBB5201687.1 3-phenylpropionate/cinnamic acid dioxygenase small subunit [Glaciimonas immobilis]
MTLAETSSGVEAVASPATAEFQPQRISVGADMYNRLTEFLYDEARLLDQIRLKEWTEMLDTDLLYTAPLRETRSLVDQAKSIIRTVQHFHDNYRSIMGRVARLTATKSAWAEDPPSRTRRLVTNVFVETTQIANEFSVRSYMLITRSRFNSDEFDLISGERHDVIRLTESGAFKLARREIILDQAVLGTPNLAIFL